MPALTVRTACLLVGSQGFPVVDRHCSYCGGKCGSHTDSKGTNIFICITLSTNPILEVGVGLIHTARVQITSSV